MYPYKLIYLALRSTCNINTVYSLLWGQTISQFYELKDTGRKVDKMEQILSLHILTELRLSLAIAVLVLAIT